MTSVGYATLQIIPSLKGIDKAISGQMGGMSSSGRQAGESFSGGFKGALPLMAAAISAIGFGALAGEAIAASDATDKFKQTLNFAGLKTDAIDALTVSARKYADQTVYDLSDIQNITAQLAANSVPNFDKLAQAAGNLNAVAGGNKETFKSVGMMLTQTAGAGKLTAENWNQLADAIPGASGMLQAAMLKNGAYTGNFRDAMEKGQITAAEFNQAIMDLGMTDAAKQAATSTATFEGAWGNLKATMVGGLSDVFTKAKPAVTAGMSALAGGISAAIPAILGAMDGIGSAVASVVANFTAGFDLAGGAVDQLIGPMQNAGAAVATFMAGLRGDDLGTQGIPWLDALWDIGANVAGALSSAQTAVSDFMSGLTMDSGVRDEFVGQLSGMVGFGAQVRGIFDQLAPVVAAMGAAFVTALVPALANLWTAAMPVVDQFNQLRMTLVVGLLPILTGLATVVTTVIIPALAALAAGFVANILPALSQVILAFQNVAAIVIPIVTQFAAMVLAKFAEWGPTISVYMTQVTQIIGGVMTIISGIVTTVAGGIAAFWQQWGGTIMSVVSIAFDTIMSVIGGALNVIQGLVKTVTSVMSGDWKGAMDGLGQATQGAVDAIKGIFDGFIRIAGSLLAGAGKAIMDGFLNGLKSSWQGVTDFVNGIGPWIQANKGPISYDRGLLKPAGKAIMGGLVDSMAGQMPALESMVGRVTDTLTGAGGAGAYELAGAISGPSSVTPSSSGASAAADFAQAVRTALSGAELRLTGAVDTIGDAVAGRIILAYEGAV